MTTYKFPTKDKTLYGLTTGTVYKAVVGKVFPWEANGKFFILNTIAAAEPDGVTDVCPFKAGDTVSTEEELDALPDGTILHDGNGAWEKFKGCFFFAGNEDVFGSSELDDDGNPFTIVWLPETGDRA